MYRNVLLVLGFHNEAYSGSQIICHITTQSTLLCYPTRNIKIKNYLMHEHYEVLIYISH